MPSAEKLFENREYISSLECFKKSRYRYMLLNDVDMQAKSLGYIGFNYLRLGMRDEANVQFLWAVHLFDSIDSNDCFHYGRVLSMSGKHHKAIKIMRRCDDNEIITDWIGRSYKFMGKIDSALYYHNKSILIEPKKEWAYKQIGKIYFARKEYKKSMASFLKLLELVKGDYITEYAAKTNMAEVCMAQGDYKGSIKLLMDIKVPPRGTNAIVVNKNNELLEEAYSKLEIENILFSPNMLVYFCISIAVFLIWFFSNQRTANITVKRKLRLMYAEYIDSTLNQAVYNIKKGRGDQAEKDVGLAKSILDKIRQN